jgi:phospholipase C
VLDDAAHAARDPDHTQACELAEMHGGAMDRYASGASGCSDPRNVVAADSTVMAPLWALARAGALADRWFQPIAGQSSSNDMYLARAQYVFADNAFDPKGAVGVTCTVSLDRQLAEGTTIADLLDRAGIGWAFYAAGYHEMAAAQAAGTCPGAPADCPLGLPVYPCI